MHNFHLVPTFLRSKCSYGMFSFGSHIFEVEMFILVCFHLVPHYILKNVQHVFVVFHFIPHIFVLRNVH